MVKSAKDLAREMNFGIIVNLSLALVNLICFFIVDKFTSLLTAIFCFSMAGFCYYLKRNMSKCDFCNKEAEHFTSMCISQSCIDHIKQADEAEKEYFTYLEQFQEDIYCNFCKGLGHGAPQFGEYIRCYECSGTGIRKIDR